MPHEDGILDMDNPSVVKHVAYATSGYRDETKFDLSKKNWTVFLTKEKAHATRYCWQTLFEEVPIQAGAGAPTVNIFECIKDVPLAVCCTHAETYVGTQTREAQDSLHGANHLLQVLEPLKLPVIERRRADFTVTGQDGNDEMAYLPLLKVIQEETEPDTQYAIDNLHKRLQHVDQIMEENNNDVEASLDVVDQTIDAVGARGEEPAPTAARDILKGLMSSSNATFNEYARRKIEAIDESPAGTFTHRQVVTWIKEKYYLLWSSH